MAAAVDTIGFISSVLGIVSFFTTDLPTQPSQASGAMVRIGIGLGDEPDSNGTFGGAIHAVYGFNGNQDYLGASDINPEGDGAGGKIDVVIHQVDNENVYARYINVVNSDDGMCMSYVAVINPNNLQRIWYGDNGRNCNEGWYYTSQPEGQIADTGEDFFPSCVYMDSDQEEPAYAGAVKIDMDLFFADPSNLHINSTQDYCMGLNWGGGPGPDDLPVGTNPRGPIMGTKRAIKRRSKAHDQMLVISTEKSHSASEICKSKTSRGPDPVSMTEELYCDMLAKVIYPLCSESVTADCFDLEARELDRGSASSSTLLPAALANTRDFTRVQYWPYTKATV